MPRAGGWLDQPLRLIVTFGAMDIVALTYRYTARPNADLSKLSSLQEDLMRWLEGNDG